MANLLVSDYDGTFNQFDDSMIFLIKMNIEAVRKFRENGNHFSLSTARNYKSIMHEIKKHNISYDYLACLDGALLFDYKGNILSSLYINSDIVKNIISLFKENNDSCKCMLLNEYGENTNDNNICEIDIEIKNLKLIKYYLNKLKSFEMDINAVHFLNRIFISSKSDKTLSIEKLKDLYGFCDENIYTIGNDKNDIEMLQNYKGFGIISSYPSVHKIVKRKCLTVSHLISKIEKEKV